MDQMKHALNEAADKVVEAAETEHQTVADWVETAASSKQARASTDSSQQVLIVVATFFAVAVTTALLMRGRRA